MRKQHPVLSSSVLGPRNRTVASGLSLHNVARAITRGSHGDHRGRRDDLIVHCRCCVRSALGLSSGGERLVSCKPGHLWRITLPTRGREPVWGFLLLDFLRVRVHACVRVCVLVCFCCCHHFSRYSGPQGEIGHDDRVFLFHLGVVSEPENKTPEAEPTEAHRLPEGKAVPPRGAASSWGSR